MVLHGISALLAAAVPAEPESPLGAVLQLYVGPDQILPLTSFLGVIVGLVLMFWRYVVALVGRVWRFLARKS